MNRQQGNRKMAGFEEQISHALMKQAGSLQVTFADEERMRCSVPPENRGGNRNEEMES